jgi:tetratricopeptide (TPR) repeat protein
MQKRRAVAIRDFGSVVPSFCHPVVPSLIFLSGIASADPRFEPPPLDPAAQAHYTKARELYAANDFEAAAAEFQAAYDVEHDSVFLEFDIALAYRKAGRCDRAADAYRAFLAANPPPELADNARIGLERCTPPPPPPPPPPKTIEIERPWTSDHLGLALAGTGTVAIVTGVVFNVLARSRANESFHPTSLLDFESSRSSAHDLELASWVLAGAGAALVAGGIVHIRLRGVEVVPAPTGVAVAGRW